MNRISLPKWLGTVLGKSIDRDGAYGPQCMDLVNEWLVDNGHAPLAGNAVDVMSTRRPDLRWTPNGPSNYPPAGAIVCFRANVPAIGTGEYGHVAVAVIADAIALVTADQNWGGVLAAHIVVHSYMGVAGWQDLR